MNFKIGESSEKSDPTSLLNEMIKSETEKQIRKYARKVKNKLYCLNGKKEYLRQSLFADLDHDLKKMKQLYLMISVVIAVFPIFVSYFIHPIYAILCAFISIPISPIITDILLSLEFNTIEINEKHKKEKEYLLKNKEKIIIEKVKNEKVSDEIRKKYKEIHGKEIVFYKDIIDFEY